MQMMLADVAVSISEFKKNPAAILREANHRPVAVLSHNKAAFYMIEPALFEAIMEEIADQDLNKKVLARLADKAQALEVSLDEL
jgi:antitoxin StbD